jgi:saccharopine dehydrogenase (NADP+, L-glutamate forming)
VISFESFTGGLITPDTDPDNPWRYKFTWNPRNVVMAGQGTAKFIQEGEYKYIPYQKLFLRTTPVDVPGVGRFEGYPNRDSLLYREAYGLQAIPTLIRGTLRYEGFCKAWNVFVQLGCCDDSYAMDGVENLTHASFLAAFLPGSSALTVGERLMNYLGLTPGDHLLKCLRWSGFFDDVPIGLTAGTPAKILEHILNKRWQLKPQDKDLIVMWHRFGYRSQGTIRHVQASLVATGNNSSDTAMAQTVGLPLGIAARLLLQGKVKERGVVIPLSREWYNPILDEINTYGISMTEEES